MKNAHVEFTEGFQKLETLLNLIPGTLFHFDRNGKILWYHPEENSNSIIPSDGIIGKNTGDFFDEKLSGKILFAIDQTLSNGQFEHEYEFFSGGELKYFTAKYSKLNENEIISLVRDNTSQKKTEESHCHDIELHAGAKCPYFVVKQKRISGKEKELLLGKRILVVEDDKFNQFLIQNFLRKSSIDSEMAENGKDAIELLQDKSFDLILMDIEMPVMDGYSATEIIRNEMGSEIPIIAVTAKINDETIQKILAAGMNDYALKPFKPDYLYAKMVKILQIGGPVNGGEPAEKVSSMPGFRKLSDTARLKQAVGNDPMQLKAMIARFLEITPAYYQEVLDAYEIRDFSLMQHASHKIKSSVELLASKNFINNIRQINKYTPENKGNIKIEFLIKYFRNSFPSLCNELRNELVNL